MSDIDKFINELKRLNNMNQQSIDELISLLPDEAVTLGDVMNDPVVSGQLSNLLRMINENNKSIQELKNAEVLLSLRR